MVVSVFFSKQQQLLLLLALLASKDGVEGRDVTCGEATFRFLTWRMKMLCGMSFFWGSSGALCMNTFTRFSWNIEYSSWAAGFFWGGVTLSTWWCAEALDLWFKTRKHERERRPDADKCQMHTCMSDALFYTFFLFLHFLLCLNKKETGIFLFYFYFLFVSSQREQSEYRPDNLILRISHHVFDIIPNSGGERRATCCTCTHPSSGDPDVSAGWRPVQFIHSFT